MIHDDLLGFIKSLISEHEHRMEASVKEVRNTAVTDVAGIRRSLMDLEVGLLLLSIIMHTSPHPAHPSE